MLRHLHHASTLTTAFLSFDGFLYFHHLNVSRIVLLYLLCRVSLELEGKKPVVFRGALVSRLCLVEGEVNVWNKDLSVFRRKGDIIITFVLQTQTAEGERPGCAQELCKRQGACARLKKRQREQAWDRSHCYIEDWEARLDMKKGL